MTASLCSTLPPKMVIMILSSY
ncbi:hypothetical protein BDFB_003107 [Asbolus verrucosus]|uniref:Uncharacterized protein n=1 Tax=Asbolus verrucosus TaxID=1661398 RepID=A0A482WAL2_ASBVE|nr:hypothetical protein BDFB_003107 [Asbolus verrucosus]